MLYVNKSNSLLLLEKLYNSDTSRCVE